MGAKKSKLSFDEKKFNKLWGEIALTKDYIKTLKPKFEVNQKNNLADKIHSVKFYDFGFTYEMTGYSKTDIFHMHGKLDTYRIYPWENIAKFKYNFKKNKNIIWFYYSGGLKFDRNNKLLNNKYFAYFPIYVGDNQKSKLINFLNEKLIEDKTPNFYMDNYTFITNYILGPLFILLSLIVFILVLVKNSLMNNSLV